jgi:hypothetical protein
LSEINQLRLENRHLKGLIVSLSAALMRNVPLGLGADHGIDREDAERLSREAEECFRCAEIPGLRREIADGLRAAGTELWAKAIELQTGAHGNNRAG